MKRLDLREDLDNVFSIDPTAAKDLDDAISVVVHKNKQAQTDYWRRIYDREGYYACGAQHEEGDRGKDKSSSLEQDCSSTLDAGVEGEASQHQSRGSSRIEVGVHIADVSHYVRPGSINDRVASRRTTTVYLRLGGLRLDDSLMPPGLWSRICVRLWCGISFCVFPTDTT